MTEVRLNFDGIPNFERAIAAGLVAGLDAASQVVAGEMKRGFTRTARGVSSPAGSPPGIQRGGLRNSIAVQSSGKLARRVGTNLPYGMIHERGGIITAKGKLLAVPIGPEGRRLAESGANLRSMNLMVINRKGRPPILAQGFTKARGNGRGAITPLFVLVRSVKIPARPWAMPARNRAGPKMGAAFVRYAKKRITEVVGVRS